MLNPLLNSLVQHPSTLKTMVDVAQNSKTMAPWQQRAVIGVGNVAVTPVIDYNKITNPYADAETRQYAGVKSLVKGVVTAGFGILARIGTGILSDKMVYEMGLNIPQEVKNRSFFSAIEKVTQAAGEQAKTQLGNVGNLIHNFESIRNNIYSVTCPESLEASKKAVNELLTNVAQGLSKEKHIVANNLPDAIRNQVFQNGELVDDVAKALTDGKELGQAKNALIKFSESLMQSNMKEDILQGNLLDDFMNGANKLKDSILPGLKGLFTDKMPKGDAVKIGARFEKAIQNNADDVLALSKDFSAKGRYIKAVSGVLGICAAVTTILCIDAPFINKITSAIMDKIYKNKPGEASKQAEQTTPEKGAVANA